MQSAPFLSHQRRLEQDHGTSNCQTLFGMKKISTDNYIRPILDNVFPEAIQPCFDQVPEQLRQRDCLLPHGQRPVRRNEPRPEGISTDGGTNAGGAGWDEIFMFAETELSAALRQMNAHFRMRRTTQWGPFYHFHAALVSGIQILNPYPAASRSSA
jgi:hypothetical protein